ncbi:reverse transcriptase [Gossypium australe]|uniref:Reverse transcriptase n=1 Tax=Gossypium australe TaxID=47621 RepID=A0A5B6VK61_9ROSI|nr:reverse transcriptase [Gossypium australe]
MAPESTNKNKDYNMEDFIELSAYEVKDLSCPRCGERAETINHLFRECPITVEVWSTLLLQNVLIDVNRDFEQWLTRVFEQLIPHNCRIFSCALWAIWEDRNLRIHNKKFSIGKKIGNFIINYIAELDGLENRKLVKIKEKMNWRRPSREFVKINFDRAFDGQNNFSASGIVARNDEGLIILSCSETHKEFASAFATEAIAFRKAVQMGMENTCPIVIIEGDSLAIIKKCNNKDQDKSMIGAYISDIQQMVNRSKHFVFKHIPRNANALAHKIAIEILKRKVEDYLEKKVLEYAKNQKLLEWVHEPD